MLCIDQLLRARREKPGELEMLDRSLEAEFESYRKTISTDKARRAFDERIERLLGPVSYTHLTLPTNREV